MKTLKTSIQLIFICALLLTPGCNNYSKKVPGRTTNIHLNNKSDSTEITSLIRKMYEWHETQSRFRDFPAIQKDTILIGIDWEKQDSMLKAFEKSNFFAKDFLDHYQKIAKYQDSIMRFGKTKWDARFIPEYKEADVDPWIDCQMMLNGYWNNLIVTNFQNYGDSASFKWTWGQDYFYFVKVKKEGNFWKISYLQGFDFKNYIYHEY